MARNRAAVGRVRREKRYTTPQELDPLGRVTAFYFTMAVSVVSVGAALSLTILPKGREQVSNPTLALFAILVLIVACTMFSIMAVPRGAAITRFRFQLVFSLVIAASLLSGLSQLGANHLARDDWGPICLGLSLLACAPYRSSYEILWFTVQGVLAAATLAAFQAVTSETIVSGIIVVVVAITPSLGLGLGAAAYSRSLVAGLLRLRAVHAESRSAHDDKLRQRLRDEDSVGELGELRSEVVPYLARILSQGYLQEADSKRAAELAAGLRRSILERLANDPLSQLVAHFVDTDGALRSLGGRKRAALRALIVAVKDLEGVQSESLRLVLSAGAVRAVGARGVVSFSGGDSDRVRNTLQPFVRMLGFEFGDAKLVNARQNTEVRFASTRTN